MSSFLYDNDFDSAASSSWDELTLAVGEGFEDTNGAAIGSEKTSQSASGLIPNKQYSLDFLVRTDTDSTRDCVILVSFSDSSSTSPTGILAGSFRKVC
jgi:hypothetical protein